MAITTFWLIACIGVSISIGCMLANNIQHYVLKTLIDYLSNTVRPMMKDNGEPNKARHISLTEIPRYEEWLNESQNYSLINIFGVIAAFVILICGGIYHSLTYIIILLCGLLLGVNVLFLPRALARLIEAAQVTTRYSLLLSAFEKANEYQKTNENKTDGGNSA